MILLTIRATSAEDIQRLARILKAAAPRSAFRSSGFIGSLHFAVYELVRHEVRAAKRAMEKAATPKTVVLFPRRRAA